MLVLSRKPGEELIIGEKIRLIVLGVRGNQVQLGVAAPPEVGIRRHELPPKGPAASLGRRPDSVNADT